MKNKRESEARVIGCYSFWHDLVLILGVFSIFTPVIWLSLMGIYNTPWNNVFEESNFLTFILSLVGLLFVGIILVKIGIQLFSWFVFGWIQKVNHNNSGGYDFIFNEIYFLNWISSIEYSIESRRGKRSFFDYDNRFKPRKAKIKGSRVSVRVGRLPKSWLFEKTHCIVLRVQYLNYFWAVRVYSLSD